MQVQWATFSQTATSTSASQYGVRSSRKTFGRFRPAEASYTTATPTANGKRQTKSLARFVQSLSRKKPIRNYAELQRLRIRMMFRRDHHSGQHIRQEDVYDLRY